MKIAEIAGMSPHLNVVKILNAHTVINTLNMLNTPNGRRITNRDGVPRRSPDKLHKNNENLCRVIVTPTTVRGPHNNRTHLKFI